MTKMEMLRRSFFPPGHPDHNHLLTTLTYITHNLHLFYTQHLLAAQHLHDANYFTPYTYFTHYIFLLLFAMRRFPVYTLHLLTHYIFLLLFTMQIVLHAAPSYTLQLFAAEQLRYLPVYFCHDTGKSGDGCRCRIFLSQCTKHENLGAAHLVKLTGLGGGARTSLL